MKNVLSIIAGILTLGVYYLVFKYLFDSLYFSFDVRPVLNYCRNIIDGNACSGVAYVSLWVMESPLVVLAFFISALAVGLSQRLHYELNIYIVAIAYAVAYWGLVVFSPYGPGSLVYITCVSIYQALLFLILLLVARHLTKPSI